MQEGREEETNIFQRVSKRRKTMQFVDLTQGGATDWDRIAVQPPTLEDEIDLVGWWDRTKK